MKKARKILLTGKRGKSARKSQREAEQEERSRLQKQNAFLKELLETRGMIAIAAKRAKVPRRTVYYWLEHHDRFREKYEDTIEEVKDMIELKGIAAQADKGNHSAASKWLASRAPERGYGRDRLELTGADGGPIEMKSPTIEEVAEKCDPVRLASMLARVTKNDDLVDEEEDT
jgi:hypothetical protein